jgi:hypothetical protein
MSCFNCGSELPEGARFCPTCGAPVGEANGIAPSPPATSWELCEIACWRGYLKADFYARGLGRDGEEIARSHMFRWRRDGAPPREGKFLAAYEELVALLAARGWEPVGEPRPWYAQRFRRRLAGVYELAAESPAAAPRQEDEVAP